MRKIRVCFPYNGDRLGGSHFSSIFLAEELMKLDVEVRFLLHCKDNVASYLDQRGHLYDILQCNTVPKERISLLPFLHTVIKAIPKIVNYIRSNNIDIVHTNCRDMHRTWGIPTRLAGAKHIWHARGKVDHHLPERWIINHCNAFIPVSEYVLNSAPRSVVTRAHQVNNPIYVTSPAMSEIRVIRNEILGGREGKIIGLFSQLDLNRKRAVLFARIAQKVAAGCNENVQFLICGRGSDAIIAEMIHTVGPIRHRMHFRGFVTPVEPWMAATDCIVAPSRFEPLGRVPLEAASLDIPVVASKEAGYLESVIDGITGFLVDPDNPDAFCEKILTVLNSTTKTTEANTIRRKFLNQFDPVTNARCMRDLYVQILGN